MYQTTGYGQTYASGGGAAVGAAIYGAQRSQIQFARMVESQKLQLEKRRLNQQQAALAAQQKNSERDYNMAMMRFNLEREKLDRDYEQSQLDREYRERVFRQDMAEKERMAQQWKQTYEQNERKIALDQSQFEARQNQQQNQFDASNALNWAQLDQRQTEFNTKMDEERQQNDVRNQLNDMQLQLQERQQLSAEARDWARIDQTQQQIDNGEYHKQIAEKQSQEQIDQSWAKLEQLSRQREEQQEEALRKEKNQLQQLGARELAAGKDPARGYSRWTAADGSVWEVPRTSHEGKKTQAKAPALTAVSKALAPVDMIIERLETEDVNLQQKEMPLSALVNLGEMNELIRKAKQQREDVLLFLANYKARAHVDTLLLRALTPQAISLADWQNMTASKLKLLNDYLAAGKFDDDMCNAEMARLLKTNVK